MAAIYTNDAASITDKMSSEAFITILENIINSMDAIIMVTVPDTGEILFINDRKKELFDITGAAQGKLCYELLHRRTERCDFCAYLQLEKDPESIVQWEARCPVTGPAHRMTSLLINWPDGRKAHLEYGVDITDSVNQQKMLESILNTLDSYIYITDMDTDAIVFVNKKMETDFGLDRDVDGDKCWKHFQFGMEKRCDFCPKFRLVENPDVPIRSEAYNPILDKTLAVVDRVIDWPDGRRVHMEHAVDITEIKRTQGKLFQREKALDIINKAALILLRRSNASFEDAMNEGVGLIADIADIDRLSVFRSTEKADGWYLTQLYRWQKQTGGTVPVLPELTDLPYATLVPAWERRLAADEALGGIVSHMPEAAVLEKFGCVTVWIVPVFDDGRFWGSVFFERLKEEVFTEQETDILRLASVMLMNAVVRNGEAEAVRQATEHTQLMLDATPLASLMYNSDRRIIHCNEAAVELFGVRDKADLLEKFFSFMPKYQPDGKRSVRQLFILIDKAFDEGRCTFDWMLQTSDGTPIPAEIIFVRVRHRNGLAIAAYARDLREHNSMMREIEYKNRLLQTVNSMSATILKSKADMFEGNLHRAMGMLAEAVDADRMYVWENHVKDGRLYCSQIYEWSGGVESQQQYELAVETLYSDAVPGWVEWLSQGRCINGIVSEMPENERAALAPQGILSVLIVPIFIEKHFWGFIGFDDCHNERFFSNDEETILRSASELIAGAVAYAHLETEADKRYYDSLTGIYNRRYFDENLPRLIQSASRSDSSLSLLMIDIDLFKTYNDTYGHIEGDYCLKAVADVLKSGITRTDDFAARYGGEEFVIVLPNTDEIGARLIAHRLVENMRRRNIPHEKNGKPACVTISIGVTTGKADYTQSASDYVRRADDMMYESKKNGRDRYTYADL